MKRRWAVALYLTIFVGSGFIFAASASAEPCFICVGTGTGGFGGTGHGGDPGGGGGLGQPVGGVPGRPDLLLETTYVPTCPGNSPDGESDLCGAAESCPTLGDTRVWIYTREYNRLTGAYVTPWRKTPGAVCVGADAPGLDPRVAVIATVRREFAHFPLEQATVLTRPAGQSLVNAVTLATSTVDGVDTITRTILGLPVVVHATAQSYTWHFGDGTIQTAPADAAPPAPVTHTYRTAGPISVSLDVVYGGTFTVGDDPTVYDVLGTATITGPPTALLVRQARTQLEAD